MPMLPVIGGSYDGLKVHVYLWQDSVRLLKRCGVGRETASSLEAADSRPPDYEEYLRERWVGVGVPAEYLRWSELDPASACQHFLDRVLPEETGPYERCRE